MEILTAIEVRILGTLLEKEFNTPEYYPLSLNSLTNACNQKSSRDPVTAYTEAEVEEALDLLRIKRLAGQVTGTDMRVPKYKQNIITHLALSREEAAVLAVLMLRGPQTVGEIKGRTGKIHEFSELAQVEQTLSGLSSPKEQPLVVKLPRQPGKDARYMHLLCGEPEMALPERKEEKPYQVRVAELEQQVADLRNELSSLRALFEDFKSQF